MLLLLLIYKPRHESEDQDFVVVLELDPTVGLFIFEVVFADPFLVMFISASSLFVKKLSPCFESFSFPVPIFFNPLPEPERSTSIKAGARWLALDVEPGVKWVAFGVDPGEDRWDAFDVEQVLWASLRKPFPWQLPSTHLVRCGLQFSANDNDVKNNEMKCEGLFKRSKE